MPAITFLLVTLGVALSAACAPKRIAGPAAPQSDIVVLLRDDETDSVGGADVSNRYGTVTLASERDAARVAPNQAPVLIDTLSEADIDEIFGEALSALPPPPLHFALHFQFESDELTDDARGLVPEILNAVQNRPLPDISVIGHTDTAGRGDVNFRLGRKRATTIRDLLVSVGLDPSVVEVMSHGENDLLVQTADETLEPLNRRVEIVVK